MASDPSNVWYYNHWRYYRFQEEQYINLLDLQVYDLWYKRIGKEKLIKEVRKVEEAHCYLTPKQNRAIIRRQLKSQYRALKYAPELEKTKKF